MSEGQQFVRFNPPPGWPLQPSSELPPQQWVPPHEWGPAPAGWAFYVDGANRAVPPPLGAWQPPVPFGLGTGGYAAPDPWAGPSTPSPGGSGGAPSGGWAGQPEAPGGYPPQPGGWAPTGSPGYAPPGTPGYAPPGSPAYAPPGTPGWQPPQPPSPRSGSRVALVIAAAVVLVVLLGGGGLWLARRNTTVTPTAAPTTAPTISVVAPTTGPSTPADPGTSGTGPTTGASPTSAADPSTGTSPTTGTGATGVGPTLTDSQLRAMLRGGGFGGVDGVYALRKATWTPATTAAIATLPECAAYLAFERANNTWYAQDTDATTPPTVQIYVYTSVQAEREQIPVDLACGKALEAEGDLSWVFKSRAKIGAVDVLTWESDGELVTEYHYGNLRFSQTGAPDPAFPAAAIAQIDGAAR